MHRIDLGRQDLEVLPPFFCFNLADKLLAELLQTYCSITQLDHTKYNFLRNIALRYAKLFERIRTL